MVLRAVCLLGKWGEILKARILNLMINAVFVIFNKLFLYKFSIIRLNWLLLDLAYNQMPSVEILIYLPVVSYLFLVIEHASSCTEVFFI